LKEFVEGIVLLGSCPDNGSLSNCSSKLCFQGRRQATHLASLSS
jgi:hypothetical protein